MKTVVLDSLPFNPGDLDWNELQKITELKIYEKTSLDQIQERIANADVVCVNKIHLTATHFAAATNLKMINVLATGFDTIDSVAAREKGILLCNIPAYSTDSVAQLTMSLILELCYRIGHHNKVARTDRWQKNGTFSFWDYPLIELAGKKIAFVGFGEIASRTAEIAKAFKADVYAVHLTNNKPNHNFPIWSMQEALNNADVISLHCPHNQNTDKMVNESFLHQMKPSAFLINTARGKLIDEHVLAEALNHHLIAGFATDTLSSEPPELDNPLLTAQNCIITPHIAWGSIEARQRLMKILVANIRLFKAGHAQNIVN